MLILCCNQSLYQTIRVVDRNHECDNGQTAEQETEHWLRVCTKPNKWAEWVDCFNSGQKSRSTKSNFPVKVWSQQGLS